VAPLSPSNAFANVWQISSDFAKGWHFAAARAFALFVAKPKDCAGGGHA
jgi:hypothetical protein